MPVQVRAASVLPTSINDEARTVEVVWTTGAPVRRYDWWDGVYYDEILAVSAEAIDLSALNAGAHVLNAHRQGDVADIIGVVRSATIEGTEGRAVIEFSRRPELEGLWADIKAGIVRNISVGYSVEAWQVERADGQIEKRTATRWTPRELSFVPVPADPGAATRSAPAQGVALYPCDFTIVGRSSANQEENPNMADPADTPTPAPEQRAAPAPATPAAPAAPAADPAVAARAAERERIQSIRTGAAALNLRGDFVEGLINDGVDLDVARARMIDEVSRQSRGAHQPGVTVQGGEDHTDPDAIRDRMSAAIVARASGGEVPEAAREFVGYSMLEMGIELARARGMKDIGRRMSPAVMYDRLTERAHTTSDFPLLMTTSSHAILLGAYQRAAPTYRRVMGQRNLPDFKPTQMLRVGDFPGLLEVGEEGEYQYGTVGESGETITLASWGRILKLGRRLIINDELGAFAQVTQSIGGRVSRFENSYAWGIVKKSPKLSDGKPIFHADHKNVAAAATIDATSLDVNQQAVMTQKDMDGQVLNLMPRYLAVGADKLTEANRAIAAITPTKVGDYNPFAGQREVVGDAEIEAGTWYEFVDPAIAPAFVYSYLTGLEGPRLTSREGFTTDGIDLRVALDFAVGAVDYRPVFRRK